MRISKPAAAQARCTRSVVAAGAFHRHQQIMEGMLLQRLPDLGDGGLQGGAVVFDDRGRDEDIAVEVAEHPLGAGLGTIDADDAEVLGSDLLDAGVNDAGRLVQDLARRDRDCFRVRVVDMGHTSKRRVRDNPILSDGSPEVFFLSKTNIPGAIPRIRQNPPAVWRGPCPRSVSPRQGRSPRCLVATSMPGLQWSGTISAAELLPTPPAPAWPEALLRTLAAIRRPP